MSVVEHYLTEDFFDRENINASDVRRLWAWVVRGESKPGDYPLHYLACCMNFLSFNEGAATPSAAAIYARIQPLIRNDERAEVAWLALAMCVRYNAQSEEPGFMSLKSKLEGTHAAEAFFFGLILRLAAVLSGEHVRDLEHVALVRHKNQFILQLESKIADSRVPPAKALFASIGEMMRIKTEFMIV